jgi:hypothetical protein
MKRFWKAMMSWAETLAEYRRKNNHYRAYY